MFMRIHLIFFVLFAVLDISAQSQQTSQFSGKITNARSAPVPGSTVYLLNTNEGAVSDEQGNFSFNNLPAGKYVMQVSAVGYATIYKDIAIGGAANESLNIQLIDAGQQLRRCAGDCAKNRRVFTKSPF